MEKYYILSWICFLFFFGTFSLVMDMIYNREEEISYVEEKKISFNKILNESEINDSGLENYEDSYLLDDDHLV